MTTAVPAHVSATPLKTSHRGRIFVLIGPPGCGKGTQSRRISEKFGVPCISTGDILRAASGSDSALGRRLRQVIASGALVDDALVNELVADRVTERDCDDG